MAWPFKRLDLKSAASRASVSKVDLLRAALAGTIKVTFAPADLDSWIAKGKPQGSRRRRWSRR